ncbi:MAG: TonB-dependent receptor, partial [Tannerellaceae bacterium]
NTHIPRFGLFFTTTIQCIWFERTQIKEYAGVPVSYFGKDGIERPFTEESATDPELKYLVKTFSNSYFLPSKRPVSFGVNLKATKELGKHLRCSFYVNRLFEYSPSYTDNLQVTRRNRTTPSFGAELMITL